MLIGSGSCSGSLKIKIKIKRHKRPCPYYANTVATLHVVLGVSDLVFKLNRGPENNRIATIISSRSSTNYRCRSEVKGVNHENLRSLKRANDESKKYAFNRLFTACLINARSVCNKTLTIKDLIVDYKIDLMGITETWPRVDGSDVISGEPCPNGYRFAHLPRSLGCYLNHPSAPKQGYRITHLIHLSILTNSAQFRSHL